jgi:cell division protein FtsB
VLHKKVAEVTEYQKRLGDLEYEVKKIDSLERENDELKRYVTTSNELRRHVTDLENLLKTKEEESHNLNSKLKMGELQLEKYKGVERELATLKSNCASMKERNNELEHNNQQLQAHLTDLSNENKAFAEERNRVSAMEQEI